MKKNLIFALSLMIVLAVAGCSEKSPEPEEEILPLELSMDCAGMYSDPYYSGVVSKLECEIRIIQGNGDYKITPNPRLETDYDSRYFPNDEYMTVYVENEEKIVAKWNYSADTAVIYSFQITDRKGQSQYFWIYYNYMIPIPVPE